MSLVGIIDFEMTCRNCEHWNWMLVEDMGNYFLIFTSDIVSVSKVNLTPVVLALTAICFVANVADGILYNTMSWLLIH